MRCSVHFVAMVRVYECSFYLFRSTVPYIRRGLVVFRPMWTNPLLERSRVLMEGSVIQHQDH